ncbi:GMP synthase-like glutamine amidotransferase [Haloferula luteola]|uniref:GMP synthase-like glutamine amidotransferase n=1 Tax=Haloferula luteola TaxID=595692 RepID=A0A840V3Z3_9BACT|nr:type 1 glutamine amidotransferase [Haloferula luteola]MBB5351776.1 GMP synthase-like glutamine amidotransferase [Haloferula luteola]
MHVHVIQHVPFEGPAAIDPWLTQRGHHVTRSLMDRADNLPDPETIDFLILMGGPMSVHDEKSHPWLVREKEYLGQWLKSGRPTLGICLGAQLMASSLGATVRRQEDREIGWFPVESIPQLEGFSFDSSFMAFHWHGETFDLPPDALPLARSVACPQQGFQWGPKAIGLQFHLETTPSSCAQLVEHGESDLVPGPFVQTKSQLLADRPEDYQQLHLGKVLDYLLRD